jgi:hypothetical protein
MLSGYGEKGGAPFTHRHSYLFLTVNSEQRIGLTILAHHPKKVTHSEYLSFSLRHRKFYQCHFSYGIISANSDILSNRKGRENATK